LEKIQLVGGPTTRPSCLIPLFLKGHTHIRELLQQQRQRQRKRCSKINIWELNGDYFAIIASSSHPLSLTEHAANGLVEALHVKVNVENERCTVVCCS